MDPPWIVTACGDITVEVDAGMLQKIGLPGRSQALGGRGLSAAVSLGVEWRRWAA